MASLPPLVPGTVFTLWRPAGMISVAGGNAITQRFHSGTWEDRVGQTTLLYHKGEPVGAGRLESAVVAGDGSGVTLTYKVLTLAA